MGRHARSSGTRVHELLLVLVGTAPPGGHAQALRSIQTELGDVINMGRALPA